MSLFMITERTKQIGVLITTALLIIAAVAYWLFFSAFAPNERPVYVCIDADDTPDSVYVKLNEVAAPSQLVGIKICGAVMGYQAERIHPGRYEVTPGINSFSLMRKLRGGQQTPVRLVIPVVHTLNDLAARLATSLAPDSTAFARAFTDSVLLRRFGVTPETVACLFLPNTYEVYWDLTPEELLQRMKREHDAFWTDTRKKQAEKAGLTTNEVYTLASIVEQESANEAERPLIAGMYLNRLHQEMKLQADPTVKFALQDFTLRRILHKHLTVDSPYNTYQHVGLPPGPICIPSLNAIRSVLNFAQHDYLYMCAKEDFSGTHNFAATYDAHLKNAQKYTKALDERQVK